MQLRRRLHLGRDTRALDRLSRDELQGVVAHEFSHLFRGDTRLNARVMGLLGGITFIGRTGLHAVRSARSSTRFRDRSRVLDGGVRLIMILGGLGLWILGVVGLVAPTTVNIVQNLRQMNGFAKVD